MNLDELLNIIMPPADAFSKSGAVGEVESDTTGFSPGANSDEAVRKFTDLAFNDLLDRPEIVAEYCAKQLEAGPSVANEAVKAMLVLSAAVGETTAYKMMVTAAEQFKKIAEKSGVPMGESAIQGIGNSVRASLQMGEERFEIYCMGDRK